MRFGLKLSILIALIAALALTGCDNGSGGDPIEVGSLTAAPADGEVTLSWTDPGVTYTAVEITFTPAAGGVTQPITVAKGTNTHTITPLTNDTPYAFTVRLVYSTGYKSPGATATATPVSGGTPPPDTTYYVSQNGDNTKDGLSSPNALATPVVALRKIAAAYADTTTPWPGKAAGTPDTAVIIVSGTITTTTGAGANSWLDISGTNAYPPITLQGAAGGGTLNAASASNTRVLNIANSNKVTLGANLTLTGGSSTSGNGGGVSVDTGTTFTMNGGTISGNTGSYGGGVYVTGTFTMNGGTISGNTADNAGGGVFVSGGTFTKTGGTIYGNTGGPTENTATNGYNGTTHKGHAVFWNNGTTKKKVDGNVTGSLSTDNPTAVWEAGE